MNSIAVLITCHNRRERTIDCLHSLFKCSLPKNHILNVYLVDDGSTDGTWESVEKTYPRVNLIKSNGSLFWGWGMNLAWENASVKKYDFYLWLNDDTTLYKDSLAKLIEESENFNNRAILCGACEEKNRTISYSGYKLKTKGRIIPQGNPIECDYFNGNVVLIPNAIFKAVGFIDAKYQHRMGDFDYGLKAKSMGIKSYVASNVVGLCNRHTNLPEWCNPSIPIKKRIDNFVSPLGGCPKNSFIFQFKYISFRTALFHFFTIHIRLLIPQLWIILKKDAI